MSLILYKPAGNRRFFSATKLIVLFCCFSFTLYAQENLVSGTITDPNGELLLGVSIIEKGTANGVVSDFDGNFSIELKDKTNLLEFSYIGFETKEVNVSNQSVLSIVLKPSSEELDEVVVIGYGTANKKDVLGSIGSVKASKIEETVPVDVLSALQGRIAGVEISSDGGPGESSGIIIRGISTLSGGVGPLYVVDGQQTDDIDNINPSDIASIDVLKDGASAAIYGSKSANGVVLITTKKGEAGYVKINARAITSIGFLRNKIPVSNVDERTLYDIGRVDDTDNNRVVRATLDTLALKTNNDLQDIISQVGFKNQVDISFTGGSETAKFYLSTGILDQDGVVIGSGSSRFTTNLKVDFDLNKSISVGTRSNLSYQKIEGQSTSLALRKIIDRRPNIPIFNNDGSYVAETGGVKNPIAVADLAVNQNRYYRVSQFTYAQIKLSKALSFKSTFGVNFRYEKQNRFNPSETVNLTNNFINGAERNRLTYDYQNENFFTYKKKFNKKHSVSGLLGFSIQKWNDQIATIDAIEFNNDAIQTLNNVTRFDQVDTGTTATTHSLSSVYARGTYDYKKKYFVAATIRGDGSSRFGANNQWGYFPSVSLGWSIDKERFMESLYYLSNFKLRAGYAITGNERIGDFLSTPLYSPGYFYDGVSGYAASQLGNPDLGWESTTQYNYGIDLSFLKNRFQISIDHYIKTTTDLLYAVPVAQEFGFSAVTTNIGSVENKGLEISISGTVIRKKDFKWFSSFNIAFNKNKILELAKGEGFETTNNAYKVEEGQPIGNMWGYTNLGVFKYDESNAFTDDGVQLTPVLDENGPVTGQYTLNGEPYTGNQNKLTFGGQELKGGDIIWEDKNGDFEIDLKNDRGVIGNGLPDFVGGFSNRFDYKNFSLSMLFDFKFGQDIYRNYDHKRDKASSVGATPQPDRINGAWKEQGDVASFPSLLQDRVQNRSGFESNYVSKGDFIRFKNLNFGYRIPKKIIEKISAFDDLSFSLVINNLMTFTNYEGYNPDLGSSRDPLQSGFDDLRYPNQTEFILGVRAKF